MTLNRMSPAGTDELEPIANDGGQEVEIEIESQPQDAPGVDPSENDEPIEVIRRQFEDVKAENEALERRARDAEARAREEALKNQRSAGNEIRANMEALDQAFNLEDQKITEAKRRYAESLRNGEYETAADLNNEIMRSHSLMQRYAEAYSGLQKRESAPVQPSYTEDPFDAALKNMHPKVAAWARDHKDDVMDPRRQELAFAADKLATGRYGYKPGTDEYLDFLDEQMGYIERQEPVTKQPSAPVKQTQRRSVAAPVSRASGGSVKKSVYLTEDDKGYARQAGLTDAEYAKYKLKAAEKIKASSGMFGNRMGIKFSVDEV